MPEGEQMFRPETPAEKKEIFPVVKAEETVEEFLERTKSGNVEKRGGPGSERSHDGSTADTFDPQK